jgi:hypothetical protein
VISTRRPLITVIGDKCLYVKFHAIVERYIVGLAMRTHVCSRTHNWYQRGKKIANPEGLAKYYKESNCAFINICVACITDE